MKKILFLMLFAIVGWQHVLAQTFTDGGIIYNVTSPTTVGVGYQGAVVSGDIAIPSQVTNSNNDVYSVTSIGNYAFYYCNSLTSVTIPNSVTSIGANAFAECWGLTSVSIPNSVTSIGDAAFYNCTSLTSVTIPSTVTSIGQSTFSLCVSLTSITIPGMVTSIGIGAFSNCHVLTSVSIPNSVTSIGADAFFNCGLTSVTFPSSITSIGNGAFQSCSGLTSITIPNSITSISASTFYYCTSLTSVTIPNSISSIGADAFHGCYGLTSVTIPSSVMSIGDSAFLGCYGLTSVICNIATPLPINQNVFEGVNQGVCSLLVPSLSVIPYQTSVVWKDFLFPSNIPTSKVRANQCGVTLTSLSANINADYVASYQQYRFEVTNTNNATVNTVDVNRFNFSLTQTAGITYGTTYGVRVKVKMGGIWGSYGVSCNVTTPVLTVNVIPTTALLPAFCGTTLATLDTKIGAIPVSAATGYRFEIITGGITTVYDSTVYNFRLADAGVAAYGTTFAIRVAAQVNGVYGNYGASCNVTTPALTVNVIPTTALLPAFCGTTLTALDTKIGANPVSAASGYRFEITKDGVTTVYDSTVYNFSLADAGVAAYGTTYSIRVATIINGVYGNYGASCDVSTPPLDTNSVPTTTLLTAVCDTSLAALDTKIGTKPVYMATGYRFEVTIENGTPVVFDSAVYNFKLSQSGVMVAYSTTYTIRAAAQIDGVYGNYGTSCTVTTPQAPARLKAKTFEVSAYPNPFETAFNLNLETPSKEEVTINVYDMLGRQVETKTIQAEDLATTTLGSNYASGVYNIIVSQDENVKTFRMMKK